MEQHFPKISRVIIIILVIHSVFFVLSVILREIVNTLSLYFLDTPEANISLLYRILTYPLVYIHTGGENLFGFMLFALFMWWVGSALEREWGSKLFVLFYLITIGISGIVCLILLNLLGITFPIMGTSGITFAIIAVFAYKNPNSRFHVFGIFPIKVKWLLLVSLVLTFLIPSPLYIVYSLLIQLITGLTAVIFCRIVFPLPLWLESRVQHLNETKENREFNKKRKRFTVYKNPKYKTKAKSLDKHTEEEIRRMANKEIDKILDNIKKKSESSSDAESEDNKKDK